MAYRGREDSRDTSVATPSVGIPGALEVTAPTVETPTETPQVQVQEAPSVVPVSESAEQPVLETAASSIVDGAMQALSSSPLVSSPAPTEPLAQAGPSVQSMVPTTPDDAAVRSPGLISGRPQVRIESRLASDGGFQNGGSDALADLGISTPRQQNVDSTVAPSVDQTTVERYRMTQAQEDLMRAADPTPAPSPVKFLSSANKRFRQAVKDTRDRISSRLKSGPKVRDNAFQDTIFSLSSIMPNEVSLGTYNLLQAVRDPNNRLVDLVNQANPGLNLMREACVADISVLADAINKSSIDVAFGKGPINVSKSIQVRRLRVHNGRGIGLHPTQTKAYNADFDGDTGNVNFDQAQVRSHSRAMSFLIDAEGNSSIDPDFFPLDPLATGGDTRTELIKSMRERNFAWAPNVVPGIADAYMDVCNADSKHSAAAWREFLRAIDAAATKLSPDNGQHDAIAARLLKNAYDYACDRRGLSFKVEWANIVDDYDFVEPESSYDPVVYDLMEEVMAISKGRPPMNFQEFTIWFHKQYGDLLDPSKPLDEQKKGKNIPFRLLADFAKAIKRTDLITIGDPVWGINAKGEVDENSSATIYDLWQFTCSAGVSKMISGRIHMGSQELAIKTQVRSWCLRHCPVPRWSGNAEQDLNTFRSWMREFERNYNSQMRMLNLSQFKVRGGMSIVREKLDVDDGFNGIADPNFAKAFTDVYGDYTMRTLFPGSISQNGPKNFKGGDNRRNSDQIVRAYGEMTALEFSMKNRLDWYSADGMSKNDAIKKHAESGAFTPYDVILQIADRRSKQFGAYSNNFNIAAKKHWKIMQKIKDSIAKRQFGEYATDMLELLYLMSPRMFSHFGMDSPMDFVESNYGKQLMAAKSEEDFKSVFVTMTVSYRLDRATNILKCIDELSESAVLPENYSEQVAAANTHYNLEMDALASSSWAWEAIVSELSAGPEQSVFQMFLRNDGKWLMQGKRPSDKNPYHPMKAASFWKETDPSSQYDLVNFLKSGADYNTKIAVLCDIVRFKTGLVYGVEPEHILGMLVHDPDPMFAGSFLDSGGGIKSSIDAVKDSLDKISSYMDKGPKTIREQADQIIEAATKHKDSFEQHLRDLANQPGYRVHVSTIFAADAISSVYEKGYPDSEKSQQQSLVNAYYEMLSLQRNGGFYTHLYEVDNGTLGMVGYDQLTPFDIVTILSDPSIEIPGYDMFGVPCVFSRKTLCGGDSVDDVIDYLNKNPRVALATRRCIAGADATSSGGASLQALKMGSDFASAKSSNYKAFSMLNDRPRFLAIAALFTPASGNVGRNLAETLDANINYLCQLLLFERGRSHQQIVADLEKRFGLSEKRLLELRRQGAFDPSEVNEIDEFAAHALYVEVVSEIESCIDILDKSGIVATIDADLPNRINIGIDKESMLAYYDVRQQLTGARTEKTINVEGAETKKNLVLKEFAKNFPDRYMTITVETPASEILALSQILQADLRAELARNDNKPIYIEIPEGWDNRGVSTESDPKRRMTSVAKFLEFKRERAAEEFNMYSKKFGDDGTNSIIKYFKYATRKMLDAYGIEYTFAGKMVWTVEDAMNLRRAILACESKDEAIPILAEVLMDADAKMGYIDVESDFFQISDYYNLANFMIVETHSTPSLAVRSLEQLSTAFRTRISDEAIESMDEDVILAELYNLWQVVGTPNDPMAGTSSPIDLLNAVPVASGFGSFNKLKRAIRPYSSSAERNFELIYSLFKSFAEHEDPSFIMPPRSEIEKHSDEMFAKLDKDAKKALSGFAYPTSRKVTKDGKTQWAVNDRSTAYDYLGRPSDDGKGKSKFYLIPGPQSLVYFDNEADVATHLVQCEMYGITALFSDMSLVPSNYVRDAIIVNDGLVVLPFFDMKLNGAASSPIAPAPGQIPFSPTSVVTSVESTTGEIRPGDASGHIADSLLDRSHVSFDGNEVFDVFELFPNVLRDIETGRPKDVDFYMGDEDSSRTYRVEMCNKREILNWVINGNGTVDYGVLEGTEGFDDAVLKYNARLETYKRHLRAGEVDDDTSFVTSDCSADEIVGFVKIRDNFDNIVVAPIVPFQLEKSSEWVGQYHTTSKKPDSYKVEPPSLEPEFSAVRIPWRYTGDLRNQYVKFFEGIGASNKIMVFGDPIQQRYLANGLPVDMMYSTKSVASRLFPTNKRMHTIISMLMMTKVDPNYAYNLGDHPKSFPGNDEFREKVKSGLVSIADWRAFSESNGRYFDDDEVNSVIKWFVDKCLDYGTVNPNVFLMSKYGEGYGEGHAMQPWYTEFEAFLDTGYNFQNALMKFMHEMNPTLVPANIEDDASKCLFKPVARGRDYDDYGTLQMLVPYWDLFGEEYKALENVYLSFAFFGDVFGGINKVRYDAADRSVDELNVASKLSGRELAMLMQFARSEVSKVPWIGHWELAEDGILK